MTYIPPQGNFGPIPVQTNLDGNGNGYVVFQPSGRTARVTRLYVSVATQVKQASVTIYRGQIGTSNGLGTIVSGSTGGLASGQIDLTDGQQLFVQWTGGDAGAVATATFDGNAIPLSEVGNDSITWVDPIAAADGTLIFPAIKSSNYIAGSSGWLLDRNGNIEVNNGTFRGDVNVTGTDGTSVRISNFGGVAQESFSPPTFTNPLVTSTTAGLLYVTGSNAAGLASLILSAPTVNNLSKPQITMKSARADGTAGAIFDIFSSGGTTFTLDGNPFPGSWVGGGGLTASPAGVTTANESTIITAKDASGNTMTYLSGHYYAFEFTGQAQTTSLSVGPILTVRKSGTTGTTRLKWSRQNETTVGNPYDARIVGEFQVSSTQTVDVLLTLSGAVGQTVTVIASADNPGIFNIYDMGPTPANKAAYLPVL